MVASARVPVKPYFGTRKAGCATFGDMVKFLQANPEIRTVRCEKTDRLYRNLRDYVTVDDVVDGEEHGIEVDAEKPPLIEKMFDTVATGLYSLEAIRDATSKEGLLTRGDSFPTKSSVEYILKNCF